jgi:hypothetical protein
MKAKKEEILKRIIKASKKDKNITIDLELTMLKEILPDLISILVSAKGYVIIFENNIKFF